jgi:phosphatidylglycerol:prolipoprotein diacylglycerol transferase
MRPTLFTIGSLPIRSYEVMVAIGFLIALYIAVRRAKKKNIPFKFMLDLGLYVLISGFVGARIFYILQHIRSYDSLADIFSRIWEGGLTYYGGFVLASLVGFIYIRSRRLPIAGVMDIIAPSLALGEGISRIGCFLAGCCFGKPTDLPIGITFPENSLTGIITDSQKVHPTQLYSSIILFCIFIVLITFQKYTKFSGQLFLSYVIMYSIYRFSIDFLRYYTPEEHLGIFSYSQVTSLVLGLITVFVTIWRICFFRN